MTTITKDCFQETLQNALERMAFVFVETAEESPGEVLAQATFHATIDVSSDERSAWLTVSATNGFVREVAASMMGLETDEIDVDEHGEPTVCELANIFGGELVMSLGGDENPLRLGLPRVLNDAEVGARIDQISSGSEGWALALRSDEGLLLIGCHY
ncbi:MAG: hypothetical protein H6838_05790 [Planctomycetes bacterium]|nr:hypothetical protein [Planctomycetota bacterium]MCB9884982.1 hypothetical protein [Planctomycetota bacterium]